MQLTGVPPYQNRWSLVLGLICTVVVYCVQWWCVLCSGRGALWWAVFMFGGRTARPSVLSVICLSATCPFDHLSFGHMSVRSFVFRSSILRPCSAMISAVWVFVLMRVLYLDDMFKNFQDFYFIQKYCCECMYYLSI